MSSHTDLFHQRLPVVVWLINFRVDVFWAILPYDELFSFPPPSLIHPPPPILCLRVFCTITKLVLCCVCTALQVCTYSTFFSACTFCCDFFDFFFFLEGWLGRKVFRSFKMWSLNYTNSQLLCVLLCRGMFLSLCGCIPLQTSRVALLSLPSFQELKVRTAVPCATSLQCYALG